MNGIQIFDTTLRDGAQTAGVNMTPEGKVRIAEKLDDFGIDIIEAGFPISGKGDFKAVQQIGQMVQAQVYGLARLQEKDIDEVYRALEESKKRGIHTFIGTSLMHRDYKLRMSQTEVLGSISKQVGYARKIFSRDSDSIMFSPEDALRTEKDFLLKAIYTAIKAGANQINIPDTVGWAQPDEIYPLMRELGEEFYDVDFSIHVHNDLGNAVANTLAAVRAGVKIVQGTIPPAFGERAGNADLVQVLMNLLKRSDYYDVNISENINMEKTASLVQCVSDNTGKRIPDNHPVIGSDTFRHSSGIHQDGANKDKSTYEIISPEELGYQIEQSFILTNQSGRAGLENAVKVYFGIDLGREKLDEIYNKFIKIVSINTSVVVTMDDVREILVDSGFSLERNIEVKDYSMSLSMKDDAIVNISLNIGGKKETILEKGKGPVEAIYKAIIQASKIQDVKLLDFDINSLSSSPSAEAKVYIKMKKGGKVYEEFGVDCDIVRASVTAFSNCLDRIKS